MSRIIRQVLGDSFCGSKSTIHTQFIMRTMSSTSVRPHCIVMIKHFRCALPKHVILRPSWLPKPSTMLLARGPVQKWSTIRGTSKYCPGADAVEENWGLTVTVYGRRRTCPCPLMRTPSVAFGGPGSSSQNSSLSTRTRTISPWSMYRRSASGESSSS